MKVVVNGVETELTKSGAEVSESAGKLFVRADGETHSAVAIRHQGKTLISYRGRVYTVEPAGRTRAAGKTTGEFKAPMPGLIVDVMVAVGDAVEKGQRLLVLEAMKTQQPVVAEFDGTVADLPVAKGQQVDDGQLLVRVQPLA
ncbi:MAG: hypothetical protein K8R88_12270 [Armatimonadetes bacterium]|nr:hypothetical protein [Armatimonadota bacterium]